MVIADLKKTTDQKMDKSVQAFKSDLAKVRTGRAHTGILDHVTVDYYGSQMPLNQVAKVTLLDSRTIGVTPFEKKMVQAVDKAIREAGLGLNPQTEGQVIRVPIPELNEERRRELTRVAAKYAEDGRIAVRHVRRDGIEALRRLEKDSEISQDEQRKVQTDIQHLTDDHIKRIDETLAQKDKEILQV